MNLAFSTRLPRIGTLAALALVGVAMVASASAGTITYSIANQTNGTVVTPINGISGGTGSFDVVVSEPTGGDKLYAYQVDLLLNQGASQIGFTSAAIEGTTAPYVFAGNSGESGNAEPALFPRTAEQ
jgi:hypothetical protein